MKLSISFANFATLAAAGVLFMVNTQTVDATAEVFFFQYETSDDTYEAMAFDHSDTVCVGDTPASKENLRYGEFVSLDANKDHESTIQTQIMNKSKQSDKVYFQACDKYSDKGECPKDYLDVERGYFSKTDVWDYYILFPSNSTICKAVTDSKGQVVYDDNKFPIGICSGCEEIWTEYNNYTRRNLSAAKNNVESSAGNADSVPQSLRGSN